MRKGMRSLWVALLIGLGGLLTLRTEAQDVKPNAWPWIDVYGMAGKPIGSIRIVQQLLNGRLDHGLVAEFVPAEDKLLADIAVTLWPGAAKKDLHFNWIQVTVNAGNPPPPVDAAFHALLAPYLDPPVGGYYGDKKAADDLPWFLDETPYIPHQSADMNIHNPNITLPYVLRWYMKPYSNALPDKMNYDTVLVLINDRLSQYQPLGGFHWTAVFPKTGEPTFTLMPFGPEDWFERGPLISAFNKSEGTKTKARAWTIRPLANPVKPEKPPKTASTAPLSPRMAPKKP